MSQERVRLKLVNADLIKVVEEYKQNYITMKQISYSYLNLFKELGYDGVRSIFTTNYTEGFDELVGFQKLSVNPEHKEYEEMFNKYLNTFKRGKTFQPLKKSNFNKETTGNFTKTKVSYTPIVEVIYGSPETMVYEEGTDGEIGYLRVKSFSTDSQDDGFYVEVERRDITQHTLDNFVEV